MKFTRYWPFGRKRDECGSQYRLRINISRPPENGTTLSWKQVDAVRIPTNEQHLVLQTFAEDALGIDIVNLLQHTSIDKLRVTLYWQNLSSDLKRYTYCMQFGIRRDLSSAVMFGKYDAKGSRTPFDSTAGPFKDTTKRSLSKSRSDSWRSKFSMKSRTDSWTSIFSKISTPLGSTDRRDSSRRPAGSEKELAASPEYMISFGEIENDSWIYLSFNGVVEAQGSTHDATNQTGQATTGTINGPSSIDYGDVRETSGQLNITGRHDLSLQDREDISSHSKDYSAREDTEVGVSISSYITTAPSQPVGDEQLRGGQGKESVSLQKVGQNEPASDNFMPIMPVLPKRKAHSMGVSYSGKSSAYRALPSQARDEQRSHSSSKSEEIGERVLVPDLNLLGVEEEKTPLPEGESPIVSEILRHFPDRSFGPLPGTAVTPGQASGHGQTESKSMKQFRESGRSSIPYQKLHTRRRCKPVGLISPIRMTPGDSDSVDITPAPNADEHWTWDEQVNAYFHVDSDTQSVIWLEDSGSEDNTTV